ncbi:hypothetical protein [Phycobacter sp. K97]|uniref:hypothetical protein n=1 Tax=Phycobacter sedimenti TaxID=3133977 RepID=UPI00311EDC27
MTKTADTAKSSHRKKRRYKPNTSTYNARLIGRFRPKSTPKATLPQREHAHYQDYLKALKAGDIPNADTLLRAFKLLDRAAAARAKANKRSTKDPGYKSIAKSLLDRHVIILFQNTVGTKEINAHGELFSPGTLRKITHTDAKGKKHPYKAYMGGVIKLSTCVAESPIATAALLAHEFWHIKERELRPNKLKEPEAVQLKGNDVFSGSENFADYLAGRVIAHLGFTEQSISKPDRHKKSWGTKWNDSESYGILIQKFRLYQQAHLAMRSDAASRSVLWNSLRASTQVDLTLGLTVEGTVTKKGKIENRWTQASGIRKDGYRVRRPIPNVQTTAHEQQLRWKGRRFVGRFASYGDKISVEGQIDKRGRMVSHMTVHYVSSGPGIGRREQSVELTDIPLARYVTQGNVLMCFELIGPQVKQHLKKLSWSWKMWNRPRAGGSGRKAQTTTTLKRVIWKDLDLIPYVQIVFYIQGDAALWDIKGKFAPL